MKGSRPLSRLQVKSLLQNTSSIREKVLLTLGFCTGYRISELLSLTVGDVSTGGHVHSHVTVKAANTKTKTGRTVVLNSDAQKAISEFECSDPVALALGTNKKTRADILTMRQIKLLEEA